MVQTQYVSQLFSQLLTWSIVIYATSFKMWLEAEYDGSKNGIFTRQPVKTPSLDLFAHDRCY